MKDDIANTGSRTISGITVQVLFRDSRTRSHKTRLSPSSSSVPATLTSTSSPSRAAPLKPGDQRDFRLIFDAVSRDWDGAYPEIRILHVRRPVDTHSSAVYSVELTPAVKITSASAASPRWKSLPAIAALSTTPTNPLIQKTLSFVTEVRPRFAPFGTALALFQGEPH